MTIKMTDEGKRMLDKAVNANNARLCMNCIHFKQCKLYQGVNMTIVGTYGDTEPPYDPNFLAERCDEFLHKAIVAGLANKAADNLWTP